MMNVVFRRISTGDVNLLLLDCKKLPYSRVFSRHMLHGMPSMVCNVLAKKLF